MAEATGPQLVPVAIEDEMRQAYLDYSMSVIVGRSLPDARGGRKAVHRRLLYAMVEPLVLPTRFPNLLVNGSTGIAVGMATNIPPHNLGETIESCIHLIDHPEAPLRDLIDPKLGGTLAGGIQGPDLPTGGILMGVGP